MKSKAGRSVSGAWLQGVGTVLLLMTVPFGAMAEEEWRAESDCAEVMIKKRSVRPAYFRVERNDEGFAYKCTLRKKAYKPANRAKFQQQCEKFVNDYIRHFNRCHDAEIPEFALNKPMGDSEEEDGEKFLIYRGQLGY